LLQQRQQRRRRRLKLRFELQTIVASKAKL
jgi:hypothetical protein